MNAFARKGVRFAVLLLLLSGLIFVTAQAGADRAAEPQPISALTSQAGAPAYTIFSSGESSPPFGPGDPPGVDPALISQLRQAAQGSISISTNESTQFASFVRVNAGGDLLPAARSQSPDAKASDFLAAYGGLFGIRSPASELVPVSTFTDELGDTHVTYQQVYQGVPVFAGVVRMHLDATNELNSINGVFVPGINLNASPTLDAASAAGKAIAEVAANPPVNAVTDELAAVSAADLQVTSNLLYVYRDGLIQGVPGPNHLVYEVEVTDGGSLRELVYINAHNGKVVNRINTVHDALFRRLFEKNTNTQVWQEGDPFPGSLNQDQQNIVTFSGHSYYHFFNAFGRDSYDGLGAELRSVNNDPTINCPNANWNGATTNYCNGVTSDDVVAHEWGHAYTQYTHNLIYQWQPGALNESYSDIWGDVVDMINGVGTDSPAPVRTVNACTTHTPPQPMLTINSPANIAGDYAAAGAAFGPTLTAAGLTGDVVLADDGVGAASDACTPLVNGAAISGNIALVDRGTCGFAVKVKIAQDAGATGVIVANNVVGPPSPMGGADSTITIPSVMVAQSTGNLIKAELANSVNATMRLGASGTLEDSYRWLMGEDSTAFGGAIRDMWAPTCMADPGKVTDAQYHCATTDGGGVHTNSGVPNHGFALLVDGGTYNGQTVNAIGMVKAAHIYWRAQSVYQTPTSKFPDHADALEAACTDLIGATLEGLSTTSTPAGPSGEVINAADCSAVSAMIAAVELRTDPAAQCNFQPLLRQGAPALCSDTPNAPVSVALETFEAGLSNWTLSNQGVYAGWPGYNWQQSTSLPGGRPGAAAFGIDPDAGNCDAGAGDISGVMRMESPDITLPSSSKLAPRLAFDHYMASEAGWDGGNLKISINGGPYNLVPSTAYTFNPYNTTLNTLAAGNTNPLAGQAGFSGTDGGEVHGSWGQSQINLAALGVQPGDTVRLRYDMGMDGCTGIDGWYVDDVNVYACDVKTPAVTVATGGTCTASNGTLLLTVGDVETPAGSLTLSASSSNTSLVPNGNIVFGGSGANRTVTITPAPKKSGTAAITITVSDGTDTSTLTINVFVGRDGRDTINGTAEADLVLSMNGSDTIFTNNGNDLVCAGNGDDTVDGGTGDDTIDGNEGNDTLRGNDGNDSLRGSQGNDGLTGGTGADYFSGGPGNDSATDFNPGEGDTGDGTVP